MPRTPAIDVVIFPFTPVTKVETFEHAPVLKDSMVHLGIWDKEFDATSLVADMDAAGVDKVLICAQEGGSWRVSHDTTRALASEYPDRLLWTAGIDPRDIMGGVRALERAVTELGAVGAHSYPTGSGSRPTTAPTTRSTRSASSSTSPSRSRSAWPSRPASRASAGRDRSTRWPWTFPS